MAAQINLKVKSDFAAASDDLKKFGTVTESERKKIEKFAEGFKSTKIKEFNDRLRRSTAAIKSTKGPTAALIHEHKTLQRQIETLIKKGLDPESRGVKALTSKYQRLEKEIEDVTKEHLKQQKATKRTADIAKRTAKEQAQSMKIKKGAMLAVGAAAVMMGKQVIDAFIDISKESARLASDAEEIEGKYNVVFRDIQKEASAAAQIIADDFDLAASTVNKLLGDTGDILTGLGFDQKTALEMSKSVGTLALDLASFTNFAGGAEGASAALTKALLGEAESAKALGIVIRQDTAEYKALVAGIMEVEKVGLVQAKALAAMRIATEQSKNAIGDYARTSGSAANVQKTLNEQIKRSKELWGESLNEGLTPLRTAFRDFLKDINDAQESEKNISDAVLGKDANLEKAIGDLKELEKTQQALFDAQATGSGDDYARVQLRQTQDRLALLEKELVIYEQITLEEEKNKTISAGKIKQDKLAADELAKRDKLSIEAFAELEKRRVSALTAEEKSLELLNQSIDKWAEYRELAGVQKLLNSLIAERAELLKEEEIINTDATDAAVRRLSDEIMFKEAIADREARIAADGLAAQNEQNEALDKYNELLKATEVNAKDLAEIGLGAMLRGFEALGASIVQEGLSFKMFGRLALTSLAEVLSALGAQLAARAALYFFPIPGLLPNIGAGAGAAAASAVAFTASGAIKAASAAFAEGGSFVTNGPMPIMVGDNIGGQERVTVEPVSSTGMNVENSNSSNMGGGRFRLVLDNGSELFGSIQQEFDNGGITVPERNVRAS